MRDICILRAKSIEKQLNGEIAIDSSSVDNYIDGSYLNLNDLGMQGDVNRPKNQNEHNTSNEVLLKENLIPEIIY